MSYQDKIKKELEGVSSELCVAFAARSALRVLPLLATEEHKQGAFGFWIESERAKHLLAVLTAIRFALVFPIVHDLKLGFSFAAATAAASSSDAADAASATSSDAADAAASSASASAASSADAAYAAAYAADFKPYYTAEVQSDLQLIKNKPDVLTYLNEPLWHQVLREDWQIINRRFQRWAKSLEAGFEVWLDWYQERLESREIDLELLKKQVDIPAEIKDQGVKSVNAYLATLVRAKQQQKQLAPLNRVRAIFIGNGAAGKTSLIRALNNEDVVVGKEEMTAGIDITEWPVEDTDIIAHFWDFGGQVMAHATHQFFLRERSLYILVMDARTEINANEQAEYWLEHIKAFGKNAPVMIVGNKAELIQINLDMHSLSEKYANIIGYYPLSCSQRSGKYQSHFDTFQRDFIEQLQLVGMHQLYFTEQQFVVMETLRDRAKQQAFLGQCEFEILCAEYDIGIEGVQNRDWLLGLLDKLGVVIHFPQLARYDGFILNPRWLTYGIYTLLYSDQAQAGQGVLSEVEVIEILAAEQIVDEQGNKLDYSPDKCGFIIDAMEEFKLCFRLPADRQKIIIPDLLPSDQPKHDFNKQQAGTLIFEFDFRGFLPRHLMPTFIVSGR